MTRDVISYDRFVGGFGTKSGVRISFTMLHVVNPVPGEDAIIANLNFFFIQRDAADDVLTRCLVGLGIRIVGCLEYGLVCCSGIGSSISTTCF